MSKYAQKKWTDQKFENKSKKNTYTKTIIS